MRYKPFLGYTRWTLLQSSFTNAQIGRGHSAGCHGQFVFSSIVKSRSSRAGCNTARTESFLFLFFIGFSFVPEEGASLTPARSREGLIGNAEA